MTVSPTPPAFVPLADAASLDAAFTDPCAVVFKHSTACTLSAMAYDEVRRYLVRPDALPVRLLDLLAHRALSDAVEARSRIRHESPQVLLLVNGTVAWHASHRGVTADAIAAAIALAGRTAG